VIRLARGGGLRFPPHGLAAGIVHAAVNGTVRRYVQQARHSLP
jgi:hypothetical protein